MSGTVERARRLIGRIGAWIDVAEPDGLYPLRLGADRRARVGQVLDEATFRALTEQPGLSLRVGGGWTIRRTQPSIQATGPQPGRPGIVDGHRDILDADGHIVRHRANLGETPVAWLARRKDASGRPWLSAAQVAAGERLRTDAEIACAGPSVTMRWDALPRAGGGTSARIEPGDRAMSASSRVEAALNACGPRLRPIVNQVCIRQTALQLAEQSLGLRRRQGKLMLKDGLQALAEFYGIG